VPTYEYECETCCERFERFQSMSDEPEKNCPKCGGPVRRLIGSGGGLIFKGSGFYSTDYRSDSYKKSAKADTGADIPKKPSADTSDKKVKKS
jgi:putative FmdB family regulatory protein